MRFAIRDNVGGYLLKNGEFFAAKVGTAWRKDIKLYKTIANAQRRINTIVKSGVMKAEWLEIKEVMISDLG